MIWRENVWTKINIPGEEKLNFMLSLHKINVYTFMYYQEKSGLKEKCGTHVLSPILYRGQRGWKPLFLGLAKVIFVWEMTWCKKVKDNFILYRQESLKLPNGWKKAIFNNIAILIKIWTLLTLKSLNTRLGQPWPLKHWI